MATRRIRDYLAGSGVWYSITSHPVAYTAQEVAEATHVPGRYMAKNVIVLIDGELAMAVVPATRDVDLKALKEQAGAREVRLADEEQFARAFADCQVGSVPPFGILFGVRTFVDIKLALQEQIAFNAGTHTDVVRMWYSDFSRLVKPLVVHTATDPCEENKRRPAVARQFPRTPKRIPAEAFYSPQCQCGSVEHMGSD